METVRNARIAGYVVIGLTLGAALGAQQPAVPDVAARGSLEEAIAIALRANPDIQIAEAKVRAASAELNRVRLEVVREITAAYAEVRWQRQAKDLATNLYMTAVDPAKSGAVSPDSAVAAYDRLDRAATALAHAEAKLPYLLGTGASLPELPSPAPAVKVSTRPTASVDREPTARMQEVLALLESRKTHFAFEEASLAEVLEQFSAVAGLSFVVSYHIGATDETISLDMDAPLRHILTALADQNDEICFVVRDYGVLVTSVEHARRVEGPTIPSDVRQRVQEEF